MSKISTIYDAIVTIVEAELPLRKRLPLPYDLVSNDSLRLGNGWAIITGGATNTEREQGCRLSIEREFSIVLTNSIHFNENATTARADLEKSMLEDGFKLIKAIEKNAILVVSTGASDAVIVNDLGIQLLISGQDKYFVLELFMTAEYFEDI